MSDLALTGYQRWRRRIVTPETIYGTLLISALIAVSEDEEPTGVTLFLVILSTIVFYVAHVFAGTIGHRGVEDERIVPIGEAIRNSSRHSLGLLFAGIPPTIVLIVCVIVGTDGDLSQSIALAVMLILLLVMGWQAMSERRASIPIRILGSVITLFLGMFVIILETLSH